MVIAVGGDGTLRAVGAVIAGSQIPMVIVPTGTGNLLARNLDLPLTDLTRSVGAAFTGVDRKIDTVTVSLTRADGRRSDHLFLAMAGIGLDAAMAAHSNVSLKAHFGWLAYIPPIARSVLSNQAFTLTVTSGSGAPVTSTAHTMIVGNCGVLTGDIVLMPAAVVDDGRLDVVLLRPGRLAGWIPIAVRLAINGLVYRRSRRHSKQTPTLPSTRTAHHRRATRFDVSFDQPQLLQIDGDIIDHVTSAAFRLNPAHLRLRMGPVAAPPA